jgi:DNA replication protein DnaC
MSATSLSTPSRPSPAEAERILADAAATARAARARALAVQAKQSLGAEVTRVFGAVAPEPGVPDPHAEVRERCQREERDRRRLDVAQRLWEASGVAPRFLDADFAVVGADAPAEQAKLVGRLRKLLEAPGMLAVVGPRGPGKTWMAAALVREFCRSGRRARYVRAMDLFRAIRRTFGRRGASEQDVIADLARPDLLVIDEIQVRTESEWEQDQLADLVDARYAALKSTVILGNLEPDALVRNLGDSITSRLQETGGILVCAGPSYRGNGKARPATPLLWDQASVRYEFTPVSPGATPTRLGCPRQ